MATRVFKETQTYWGTWLAYFIILIELPTMVLLGVLYVQADDKAEMAIAFGSVILILGLVLIFIFNIKLETRIDDSGVSFRFFPFINKWRKYDSSKIQSIKVISYSPITDFGGWGLKGNSKTKAYSILGDQGLLMNVGEKKEIMIGTAKSKELKEFLETWKEDSYAS